MDCLSLLEIRKVKKHATARMCCERSILPYWLAGNCRWRDSQQNYISHKILQASTSLKQFALFCILLPYHVLKWPSGLCFTTLNQLQNSLTRLQKDCPLGWHECCPCQSGTWFDHRRNASSAGRWGLVSPGWYPGGPGSPGTVHLCGTVAASSSLGPCSPPGHLQKGKEHFRAMETWSTADCRVQELSNAYSWDADFHLHKAWRRHIQLRSQ